MFLVVVRVAEFLQHANRAGPLTIVSFVKDHIFGNNSELISLPHWPLERGKLAQKHQVSIHFISAKASLRETDALVVEQALLKAQDETFHGEDEIGD